MRDDVRVAVFDIAMAINSIGCKLEDVQFEKIKGDLEIIKKNVRFLEDNAKEEE